MLSKKCLVMILVQFLAILQPAYSQKTSGSSLGSDVGLKNGFDVGNGGDVIICRNGGNSKDEMYSLDFLLFSDYETLSSSVLITEVHFERILGKLKVINPAFYRELLNFTENIFNQNPVEKFLWIPSFFELVNITDEGLIAALPKSCHGANGNLKIEQAVIRVSNDDNSAVNFYYDRDVLTELQVRFPLQFSYLMVHEFLWEFFKANEIHFLRSLNQYLHSTDFLNSNADEFGRVLNRYGILLANDINPEPIGDTNGDVEVNIQNENHLKNNLPNKFGSHGNYTFDFTDELMCGLRTGGKPLCIGGNGTAVEINDDIPSLKNIAAALTFACGIDLENKPHCFGVNANKIYRNFKDIMQRSDLSRVMSSGQDMICFISETGNVYCVDTGPSDFGELAEFLRGYDGKPVRDLYLGFGNHCIKTLQRGYCWGSYYDQQRVMLDATRTFDFSDQSEIIIGKYSACSLTNGSANCVYSDTTALSSHTETVKNLSPDIKYDYLTIGFFHACFSKQGISNITCKFGSWDTRQFVNRRRPFFVKSSGASFCFIGAGTGSGSELQCQSASAEFDRMASAFRSKFSL